MLTSGRVCGVRVGPAGQCRQERVKTLSAAASSFSESEIELDVLHPSPPRICSSSCDFSRRGLISRPRGITIGIRFSILGALPLNSSVPSRIRYTGEFDLLRRVPFDLDAHSQSEVSRSGAAAHIRFSPLRVLEGIGCSAAEEFLGCVCTTGAVSNNLTRFMGSGG